ncbi:hypothetical protein DVH26_25470 [Paenibacillus sp. H1-7]|nr:hypothetical protein DVH26_25470 [Paenibacillus sp. H1-7]
MILFTNLAFLGAAIFTAGSFTVGSRYPGSWGRSLKLQGLTTSYMAVARRPIGNSKKKYLLSPWRMAFQQNVIMQYVHCGLEETE